ncbi:MAG: UDP-N-acetylmuramyl-tripeptide synthetase [Parcubacteria group bacterium]|nr:UDP-N-acetylmuramyl-tripeptide synthetase [Parcubacteria group bacterium]
MKLETILRIIKKLVPTRVFTFFQPAYHFVLACLGAILYRFPGRTLHVTAVTGTKGKTTVTELLGAIFTEAGYTTATSSTLRFTIAGEEERNMYKMSLPGRFFLQRFLRRAHNAGCTHVIVEVTSEAAKQYRHLFVPFDGLVFTNITPEHIESHGSFEKYLDAKLSIGRAVAHSSKRHTVIVANTDDAHGRDFLALNTTRSFPFSFTDAPNARVDVDTITLPVGKTSVTVNLSGRFNLANILAAIRYARAWGITDETICHALKRFPGIRGRMEKVDEGQNFEVLVDYAHTPESLEAAYGARNTRKICILGGTGGGRDREKRARMGRVANAHCDHIILTDEDPYDEDPEQIVRDVKEGISSTPVDIIMDRREAIARGCALAQSNDTVYITGKGTDPYIVGPEGKKTSWDDASVVREVLQKKY